MKFDFWTDLPHALINISEETISREELEFSRALRNLSDVNI